MKGEYMYMLQHMNESWNLKIFLFIFVALQPWSFKVKFTPDSINGKTND